MDRDTLGRRRGIEWMRSAPARLRGWRLELDKPSLLGSGEGMATIVRDEADEVWGVLYEIAAADLEHLELTEGVAIGHYSRELVTVEADPAWAAVGENREAVEAFTLVSDERDPSIRPTTRYLGLLLGGAAEHGLPAAWIERLRARPAVEEDPEAAAFRETFVASLRR